MKTVLNVKTDKRVKETAQKVAKEMGVPLSTIVNAFLMRFIQERQITLIAPTRRMSKTLEKSLDSIDRDIRHGKSLSPTFEKAEEAIEWLNTR